jgi:hypothetical protein
MATKIVSRRPSKKSSKKSKKHIPEWKKIEAYLESCADNRQPKGISRSWKALLAASTERSR